MACITYRKRIKSGYTVYRQRLCREPETKNQGILAKELAGEFPVPLEPLKNDECLSSQAKSIGAMDDFSSARHRTNAPENPEADDGYWMQALKTVFKKLEALGLSWSVPKPASKKHSWNPKRPCGDQERMPARSL